jgi:predicted  nucleic acid-binding Zn-ribbon protein
MLKFIRTEVEVKQRIAAAERRLAAAQERLAAEVDRGEKNRIKIEIEVATGALNAARGELKTLEILAERDALEALGIALGEEFERGGQRRRKPSSRRCRRAPG